MSRGGYGQVARVFAVIGAIVAGGSMWTNWFPEETGIDGFEAGFVGVFLVAAGLALVCAIADWFVRWPGLLPISGAIGMFLVGLALYTPLVFDLELVDYGVFVAIGGAALLSFAGLLGLMDSLSPKLDRADI